MEIWVINENKTNAITFSFLKQITINIAFT